MSDTTSDLQPIDPQDKRCAPGTKFEMGSCIKLALLIEMAEAYNASTSDNKIELKTDVEILNPKKYKKYLIQEFKNRLGDKCTTQQCWTQQSFISKMKTIEKTEIEKFTFRPVGPSGKFEWLSNLQIDDVMKQYEKKDPSFKFLGAVPIDFDEFDRFGIKNLNFSTLETSGITKTGIVFNLDEHDQSGSHWVALYCDFAKCDVYFFDSFGIKPEKRIRCLMRKFAKYIKDKHGKLSIAYNKIKHQYDNSECGVYSINFIIRMLRGDNFDDICQSQITDTKINKCRNIYFVNSKV